MVSSTFGAANLAGRRRGGEASGDDAVELGSWNWSSSLSISSSFRSL